MTRSVNQCIKVGMLHAQLDQTALREVQVGIQGGIDRRQGSTGSSGIDFWLASIIRLSMAFFEGFASQQCNMGKGYRLTASTGIHKGDREYQQDQVVLLNHPRSIGCVLAVVADGMGGRSGGRKASDQVMLTATQLFERYAPETDDAMDLLRQLAREAHLVIKLTAVSSEEEPHSTLAAFLINPGGDCYWIHTGDSRIYHFKGQRFIKRTLDHSYVQELVNRGEITEEEANSHPDSNVLTACLGTEKDPPMAMHFIPALKSGDVLMACSDGIWHYLSTEELGVALSGLSAREATEFLIDKALSRGQGGNDNLSLVVVKLEPLDD
jgi:serine/threonine protein phosphatase PrpC